MTLIRYWKSALFAIFILILCLLPSESIHKMDFLHIDFQDLAAHFILFFVFGALLTYDFRRNHVFRNDLKKGIMWLLVILIAFALLTEALQFVFPSLNRNANAGDLLFDLAGALLGTAVIKKRGTRNVIN